jgi:cell division protein FtsI/penicillin-binding protein 2
MKLPGALSSRGAARSARGRGRGREAAPSGLTRKPDTPAPSFIRRAVFVGAAFGCIAVALGWKAVTLQFFESDFLKGQGEERAVRVATVVAHRGNILDRAGEPLAISTPVDAVWVNPSQLARAGDDIPRLAS